MNKRILNHSLELVLYYFQMSKKRNFDYQTGNYIYLIAKLGKYGIILIVLINNKYTSSEAGLDVIHSISIFPSFKNHPLPIGSGTSITGSKVDP